jgi:hypothetical protein
MRRIPSHWWLSGVGKARPADEIFRFTRVAGGRAATFRRLFRIGPFGLGVIRYRPDEDIKDSGSSPAGGS